jgi:hypothetical protein
MLAVARDRLGAEASLCVADGRDLPFANQSFDVVVALFLLGHAPALVRKTLLSEFQRVTKRYLVVSVPLVDRIVPLAKVRVRRHYYPHRTFYPTTRAAFEEELNVVGFRPVRWVPVLNHVAATWFALASRFGSTEERFDLGG